MPISALRKPRPCRRRPNNPPRQKQGRIGFSGRASGKPVVCMTMGYPAGIGPEIIVKALASPGTRRLANFLIIGDEFVFKKALSLAGESLSYQSIQTPAEADSSAAKIFFLDLRNVPRSGFSFGIVSASYGRASIDYIREAVSLIRSKRADLLVTAPIHKRAAELSGFRYAGHTEYLARLSATKDYAMMLMGGPLKVALATTHLPIKAVPAKLKRERIVSLLGLTDRSLRRYFGIALPRIAVCGLNPHAGEDGTLGDEEKRIIAPAVEESRKKGIDAYGPLAADAVFYHLYKPPSPGRKKEKAGYDCAVCMYHDQGLVALKMVARDQSVNITLGLPFIRTSPGHGTALDIAKAGRASSGSMEEAIRTAVEMFTKSKK